ncbi:glutathione S-transferase [Baffinella frigidus]|nr:glutathione S-transferase [Cryptophyta sp. CCMP2293]
MLLVEGKVAFTWWSVDVMGGQLRTPESLALNPRSVIPLLLMRNLAGTSPGRKTADRALGETEEAPFSLTEAHSIMRFVCGHFPSLTAWYPCDIRQRARVDEYLDWHLASIRVACSGIMFNALGLAHAAASSRVRSELRRAAAAFLEGVAALERDWLSQGHEYITGTTPTIADVIAICDLETVEFLAPDLEHLPHVTRWRNRMRRRPSFSTVSQELWVLTKDLLVDPSA